MSTISINLSSEIEDFLGKIAKEKMTDKANIIQQAIYDMIEDYQDVRKIENAIKDNENKKYITLAEIKKENNV